MKVIAIFLLLLICGCSIPENTKKAIEYCESKGGKANVYRKKGVVAPIVECKAENLTIDLVVYDYPEA